MNLAVRTVPLSLVVPALDEAEGIVAFLEAAHAALRPQDELLLVDGGSRDGTPARAREAGLSQVRVLDSPRGRGRQLNAGARVARGHGLLFLHADCLLASDGLEHVRRALRVRPAAWGYLRVRLDAPGFKYRVVEQGIRLRSRLTGTATGDQGIFVGRDLFREVGGFPETPLCEDLLLVDRLRRRAPGTPLEAEVRTSARRWEERGVVSTTLRMWGLRAAFRLGVSPQRLSRHYSPVR